MDMNGSPETRDFSNYILGDNVYELSGGLIPEIAETLQVPIQDKPNSDNLQSLMQQLGPNKELRNNPELDIELTVAVDFVVRSGVQKALNRSVWSPELSADEEHVDAIVFQGGVANWQQRTANTIIQQGLDRPVYGVVGDRVMGTNLERLNQQVSEFHRRFDRFPTETEYAKRFIQTKLQAAGHEVTIVDFPEGNGDRLFASFLEAYPEVANETTGVAVARVANAGLVNALQLRKAARAYNSAFDGNQHKPQLFVMTDDFPVACRSEELAMPSKYQNPMTALRQVVLAAKMLHEAEV